MANAIQVLAHTILGVAVTVLIMAELGLTPLFGSSGLFGREPTHDDALRYGAIAFALYVVGWLVRRL